MERETAMKILKELHGKSLFVERTALETLIPELADSNDERIRKALIEMVHDTTGDELWVDYNVHKEDALAWLEKQKSVREIVERCKNSWYNEGKIAGMAEGLTNDEKYQQGWHDALEKQGEQKPTPDTRYKVSANGSLSIVNGKPFDYEHATITQKDFAPKPTEWSDEDEEKLQDCIGAIWAADYYLYEDKQDMEAWLKRLKDRIGGKL